MINPILFYGIALSISIVTIAVSMIMICSKGFTENLITIKKYDPPFDYTKMGAK